MKVILGVLLLAATGARAGGRVNGGNWEATMLTDGDARKVVFCLTVEQATALNADSKTGKEFATKKAGDRCSVKSYDATGDTVSFTLVCGTRTLSDVTHFHGDTSDGVKTVTFEGKSTSTSIKSRRLGACP